jgi:hypothetical protein
VKERKRKRYFRLPYTVPFRYGSVEFSNQRGCVGSPGTAQFYITLESSTGPAASLLNFFVGAAKPA